MNIDKGLRHWTIGFLLIVLLSACGGSDSSSTETPSEEQLPGLDSPEPGGSAPTAGVSDPSYPAPPTRVPGYPPPATLIPRFDPYPGGRAIILHSLGEQCADDAFFAGAADAVEQLEAEGIRVLGAEEVDLLVCSACGCPTSTHIRLEINPDDLAAALALGWQRGQ